MTQRHPPCRNRLSEGRDFEPCTILPAQFFEPRVTLATGEQRLLMAMLEDVMHLLHRRPPARSGRARRDASAARAWIEADDPTFAFSFVSVCSALGLDPAAIRRELRVASRVRRMAAGVPEGPPTRQAVHG